MVLLIAPLPWNGVFMLDVLYGISLLLQSVNHSFIAQKMSYEVEKSILKSMHKRLIGTYAFFSPLYFDVNFNALNMYLMDQLFKNNSVSSYD